MVLLLTVPGLVLLSFLKEQYQESLLDRGKWTFIIGTSVVVTTLLSVILLLFRSFNVYILLVLYGVAGLGRILWLIYKGEKTFFKKLLPKGKHIIWLLPVLLVASILYFQPTEYYIGGRDPGVYVNAAVNIAKTGDIMKQDSLIDEVRDNYPGVFEVDTHKYAGFYLENRDGEMWLNPQFYHAYSAWLAIGYQLMGGTWFLYITPLLGLISILVIYRCVSQMFNQKVGLIAAGLLAVNISQIWYARGPYTEILSQLLVWFSIYILLKVQETNSPVLAVLAGLSIGASILVRLDNIVLMLPLALCLAYIYLKGSEIFSLWIKELLASLGFCALIFFIYVYQYGREYTHFQLIRETAIPDGLTLTSLFALLGAGGLAGMLLIWGARKPLGIWVNHLESKKSVWKICLTIVALAAYAYLYFIRPYQPNVDMDGGLRSFREESLVRLGWYLSPFGIALSLGGLILFILKRMEKKHLFFALLVLLNFSLFLYDPSIYPEHFWAVRRHVPFIIPAMVVFIAVLLEELLRHPQKWIKGVGVITCLSLVGYFGMTARPFLFHAEYGGVGKQLEKLAQKFDNNDIILTVDTHYASRLVGTPLDLIYGKKVLPLKEDYNRDVLERFLQDKKEQGYSIYFIITPSDVLEGIQYEAKDTVNIRSYIAKPSLNHIPANLMERNWTFEIIQWEGVAKDEANHSNTLL